MPILPFPPYRPDLSDINGQHTTVLQNVLPQADGYGPMADHNSFTEALAARPRGLFYGLRLDGTVKVFAGTETKLYVLDNTTLTWSDASSGGGTYSALDSGANWSFAQYNDKVVAVQKNAAPQVFDVDTDTTFAALGGSPPQAAHVSVVNRFLVLSQLNGNENRVQWSGLNAITTWISGTNYSDYQDLPDGGNVQRTVGGEFGIIVQERTLRRMIFSPGSDIVFQIERIAKDLGSPYPGTVVESGGVIYMYSTKGFRAITPDGSSQPIGKERVDRTFLLDADNSDPSLIFGCADPQTNRIFWFYRNTSTSTTNTTNGLVYDTVLDKWSPLTIDGTYAASISRPGITLESLNTIGAEAVTGTANNGSGLVRLTVADTSSWSTGEVKVVADVGGTTEANGTWTITVVDATHIDLQGSTYANAWTSGGYVNGSLDAITVSLDDFEAANRPKIAFFDENFELGYFTGDNLEAVLTAAEQTGVQKRMFIRGLYPISDAPTVYGSVGRRENLNATASYTTETLINGQGFCPQRASARHARAKLRIPAATEWTYATGVEPDYTAEGKR